VICDRAIGGTGPWRFSLATAGKPFIIRGVGPSSVPRQYVECTIGRDDPGGIVIAKVQIAGTLLPEPTPAQPRRRDSAANAHVREDARRKFRHTDVDDIYG
jgi:hypothetical protein